MEDATGWRPSRARREGRANPAGEGRVRHDGGDAWRGKAPSGRTPRRRRRVRAPSRDVCRRCQATHLPGVKRRREGPRRDVSGLGVADEGEMAISEPCSDRGRSSRRALHCRTTSGANDQPRSNPSGWSHPATGRWRAGTRARRGATGRGTGASRSTARDRWGTARRS